MNEKAIYAGTFDPITLGHLDVVERAAKIFDVLIIGVAAVTGKDTQFTQAERVELVGASVEGLANVQVQSFEGLLVDYAQAQGAGVIIRG